jgi:hypothetical protein
MQALKILATKIRDLMQISTINTQFFPSYVRCHFSVKDHAGAIFISEVNVAAYFLPQNWTP